MMPTAPSSRPCFLADAMLSRLARWLRVLDFDTYFDPEVDDPELVRLADRERRILLTRDRHLVTHLQPQRSVLVVHDKPLDQLRQVIEACRLEPPPALFVRCAVCNTPLRDARDDEIAAHMPARSRSLPGTVSRCPGCLRMYWPGSHTWRMRATLEAALPGWL
ncbi:MAG: Mut7-C RNAse domain-containing protein [Halomonas sp.]|nr:Mut7-C RNAse domain-containing protein [Halomonas sp.]